MYNVKSAMTGMKDRVNFERSVAHEKKSIKQAEGRNFGETLKNTITGEKVDSGEKARPVDKKLMNVCIEMESLFVSKMLKEMRKTVHKNDWLHGGFAEEVFEDMLYDKYALEVSKKANLGLANQLYNEMSKL